MTKSERLNDMLLYLNDKKTFQLKSIMQKYSISKSTALRDIQSLEELGMPIYSTSGRNGYYAILPNRLLSPILFTMDEIHALYFSMQTLTAYQSTPFHLSIEKLKQKFEGCIAEEQTTLLRKMERVFQLGSYQNTMECQYLKEIVHMAVNETVCEIRYRKGEAQKQYSVQFFHITSAYGQWYATAYNFETKRPQVFRCDKITSVQLSEQYESKPISEFLISAKELYREKEAIDFEVGVSAKGADLFRKESYPSMELHCENEKWYVRGFYNKGEENFIASYFAAYGETIFSIHPTELKDLILERLDAMKHHFALL